MQRMSSLRKLNVCPLCKGKGRIPQEYPLFCPLVSKYGTIQQLKDGRYQPINKI